MYWQLAIVLINLSSCSLFSSVDTLLESSSCPLRSSSYSKSRKNIDLRIYLLLNLGLLCNVTLNTNVPKIYICNFLRKCYQAFDSEDSLFNHVTSSHEGRLLDSITN